MNKQLATREANKALKWIIRSGTAQVIIGTAFAAGISYINDDIALVVFVTNMLSVIGQGVVNYLDYLKSELDK